MESGQRQDCEHAKHAHPFPQAQPEGGVWVGGQKNPPGHSEQDKPVSGHGCFAAARFVAVTGFVTVENRSDLGGGGAGAGIGELLSSSLFARLGRPSPGRLGSGRLGRVRDGSGIGRLGRVRDGIGSGRLGRVRDGNGRGRLGRVSDGIGRPVGTLIGRLGRVKIPESGFERSGRLFGLNCRSAVYSSLRSLHSYRAGSARTEFTYPPDGIKGGSPREGRILGSEIPEGRGIPGGNERPVGRTMPDGKLRPRGSDIPGGNNMLSGIDAPGGSVIPG